MRRPGFLLSLLFACGAIQAQTPATRDSACQQAIDEFLAPRAPSHNEEWMMRNSRRIALAERDDQTHPRP